MRVPKKELIEVLDRFPDIPMTVAGDLILDHYIWGRVERISPEAPVVVVQVTEENSRLGGAANVANNLIHLGAKVSLIGAVGDDVAGRDLTQMFRELGGAADGIKVDASRPTTRKTRVIAHSQQVVRVDHEASNALPAALTACMAECLLAEMSRTKGIIISDYAKGVVTTALFDAVETGYKKGFLGLDKIPVVVDPKYPNFPLYRHVTVIKPNRKEAEEATHRKIKTRADGIAAAEELLQMFKCEVMMITMGELGIVVVSDVNGVRQAVEVETVAREVYDVSGAGDTVSAVFGMALAAKATLAQAAILANFAAGVVVQELGTVPVTIAQLRDAIEKEMA